MGRVRSGLQSNGSGSLAATGGPRQPPSTSAAQGADASLLFAEDVAAMLGMTRDWVYAETRTGRIPHVTLGRYYRYRAESIDAWLRDMEKRSLGVPRGAAARR
jgi:excisionase family DNA binding protein